MKKILAKSFPFSYLIVAVVLYLSFFNPPSTDLDEIPNIDKVVHILMYAGVAGVVWLEYLFHYRSQFNLRLIVVLGWLLPILMSGCIELGQEYLTTNRSGDWFDFLSNATGATLAALFAYYVVRPRMK